MQMRLDFNNFMITGPSTDIETVATIDAGAPASAAGIAHANAGRCLTDTFSASVGGGGASPPTICGMNTGDHSNNKNKLKID